MDMRATGLDFELVRHSLGVLNATCNVWKYIYVTTFVVQVLYHIKVELGYNHFNV